MPKIEAFDEAVIDGPPDVVFKAILDEAAGVTHWWMPHWESKIRSETPIIKEGAVFDMTVHRTMTSKFSGLVTEIIEGEMIKTEFSGDIEGMGEWKFIPENGKTRLQ